MTYASPRQIHRRYSGNFETHTRAPEANLSRMPMLTKAHAVSWGTSSPRHANEDRNRFWGQQLCIGPIHDFEVEKEFRHHREATQIEPIAFAAGLAARTNSLSKRDQTPFTMYRSLGAHLDVVNGVAGTRFAVWAPNATEVSVVGDANSWTHGKHALLGSDSGVWSGFFPAIGHGDVYKYSVRTCSGELLQKSDPYAFYCEHPPKNASVVYDLGGYEWQDA
jgi:hypothetical protein